MTKARDKKATKKGGAPGSGRSKTHTHTRNHGNNNGNGASTKTGKTSRSSPHARFGFQQHSLPTRNTHTSHTTTRTKPASTSSTSYRRNKSGDQSSFGPLRFPEQASKYKIRTGHSTTNTLGANTSATTPTKKRNRDRFQLRLPAVTPRAPLYQEVAWFEAFDEYSHLPHTQQQPQQPNARDRTHPDHRGTNNQKHDSNPCLATDFFPSDALEQLSRELHAFAGYVRLQPQEHEARQCMIRSITHLADRTFAGGDNVQLQVFGSYATPQVCTYCSDVDMALWGVVDAPNSYTPSQNTTDTAENEGNRQRHDQQYHSHTNLDCNDEGDDDDDDNAMDRDPTIRRQKEKQDKMRKWREVLQAFADQQRDEEKKDDPGAIQNDLEDPNAKSKAQIPVDTNGQEQVPFFVIDRVGEMDDTDSDNDKFGDIVTKVQEPTNVIDLVDSDENDQCHAIQDDHDTDSAADSADKLETMLTNRTNIKPKREEVDDADSSTNEPTSKRRKPNYEDDSENNTLEVSFHSHLPKGVASPATVGPVGKTRNLVVRALQSLKNGLHKNRMFGNIEIRRFARVPIVTMESRLGFEADVAIGGHNGTDTSHFAATLVNKYKSFAPVVLFLKILLNQQDLDKPFTGGLGSYKLYVMVCHHLEIHLSLGGSDTPGEVLASFFYRFGRHGSATTSHKVSKHCQTRLDKNSEVECHDGLADLKPCHHLEHCIELFSNCWTRLSRRLASKEKECSYLVEMIRQQSLRAQRDETLQRASNVSKYSDENVGWSMASIRPNVAHRSMPIKQRSISHSFDKRTSEVSKPAPLIAPKTAAPTRPTKKQPKANPMPIGVNNGIEADADEEVLLRGYGVRRDINGTLIPRCRPDVEQRPKALAQLIGKVSKNRKNKKKQKRDKGLQAIAREMAA